MKVLPILIGLWVMSSAPWLAARNASTPPNIVFILIDDLGYSDVACYGNDYYETPHIDRLAADGVRFTQAYAASTICSPSRVSLLTGKYPGRLHITHAIPIEGWRRDPATRYRDADYVKNLPLEEVTLAEALKPAGYKSAYIGKWHGSWEESFYPEHQGFEINLGGNNMGNPGSYFHPYAGRWRMTAEDPWNEWKALPDGHPGEYLTDRLTDETIRFMAAHRDGPFMVYLAHYGVHTPMEAKPELEAHFSAKAPDTVRGHTNPTYAAMIASVDESVGRIRNALGELGVAENTIIVFTSDNGGYGRVTSNHPLRGNKGNFYEGGIRVPTIVTWPGAIPGGVESDAIAIGPDFYPTLLELAGLPLLPEQHVDGISLAPVLRGTGTLHREAVFWDFPNYIGRGHPEPSRPCTVVRAGEWKMIESLEDGSVELYNLKTDPQETTNVAVAEPKVVAELRARLVDHRIAVQAQYPRPRHQ